MKRDDSFRDVALLFVRGALGASIAAHGAQKLFGWFGGPGPEGSKQMMQHLGFNPPDLYANLASWNEVIAGVLIATGTLGPVGPAMLAASMATAVGSVHYKNGYWNQNQGFELNTMYVLAATLLALEDSGRISLDEAAHLRDKHTPLLGVLAIAGGIAGGLFMLTRRETQPPAQPQANQNGRRASTESGTIGAPAENIIPES